MIDDVEFQLDVVAIGQDARDAAVIFVAQNDGGHRFGGIIGAVLESSYASVTHTRIISAKQCTVCEQKFIDLSVDLRGSQRAGRIRLRLLRVARTKLSGVGVLGIKALGGGFVLHAARRGLNHHRHNFCFADQNNLAFDFVFHRIEVGGELFFIRLLRRDELKDLPGNGAIGARSPGQHLEGELIMKGRERIAAGAFIHPSWMSEIPGLKVRVGESPACHLFHGPVSRGLVIG